MVKPRITPIAPLARPSPILRFTRIALTGAVKHQTSSYTGFIFLDFFRHIQ